MNNPIFNNGKHCRHTNSMDYRLKGNIHSYGKLSSKSSSSVRTFPLVFKSKLTPVEVKTTVSCVYPNTRHANNSPKDRCACVIV